MIDKEYQNKRKERQKAKDKVKKLAESLCIELFIQNKNIKSIVIQGIEYKRSNRDYSKVAGIYIERKELIS